MQESTSPATDAVDTQAEFVSSLIDKASQFAVDLSIGIVILIVTLWLSSLLSKLAKRGLSKVTSRGEPDPTMVNFVGSVVRWVVLVLGLVAVVSQLGVPTTSILAALGAAGLAIGLALQGTLSNVASGVMLLILRPYREGDFVEVGGQMGTVTSLDLFTTTMDAPDGLRVTMPNGQIFSEAIVNYTVSGKRRTQLDFGIDYEDDMDVALEVIERCVRADERVLQDQQIWTKVTALGDSSIICSIRFWTKTGDFLATGPDLIKLLKVELEAAGVSFPFPQQVEMNRAQARGLVPVDQPTLLIDAPAEAANTVARAPAPAKKKATPKLTAKNQTSPKGEGFEPE